MFTGSIVKVPGTTSVRMWTLSEFEQEFGRTVTTSIRIGYFVYLVE